MAFVYNMHHVCNNLARSVQFCFTAPFVPLFVALCE